MGCLQNCHLAVSWMPTLERFLETGAGEEVHEDYRLWLTSMPTTKFPVAILQNSIKVTNEPPKGLANNLMRTFLDLEEKEYEGCTQPGVFKKLMFGLAFFHAVLLERRKFGAIGWNIPYEWMTSDLVVSQKQLQMYLDERPDQVPWETLREIIGEVNYAGRVTDDKDQRCVRSLLASYFNPGIVLDDFRFTDLEAWHAPTEGTLEDSRDFIKQLQHEIESPEAFGLHPNADITLQLKESKELMDVLVSIQPRDGGTGGGMSNDEIVELLCADFNMRLPRVLSKASADPSVFEGLDSTGEESNTNTLGVFLGQELVRYNKLLLVMGKSIRELQKAIKGLVVMSSDLETMFNCFIFKTVPPNWEKAGYPSLKPLASWFADLVARVEEMRAWMDKGVPNSFWLSGYFFPQGFMTAVLQKYARRTQIPIDTLRLQTKVMSFSQEEALPPEKGVMIHGLFLQGAGWDRQNVRLVESKPEELFIQMPVIWLNPVTLDETDPDGLFPCPTYKTSTRAGTLSTTGHSTNFVLDLFLPSLKAPDHWVRRGVAMLLNLDT